MDPLKRKCYHISVAEKQIIVKLYNSTLEQNPEIVLADIIEFVAKTVGVSSKSVRNVLKELKETNTLTSPQSTRERKKSVDEVEEADLCVIRRKVHDFFFRNEIPTIDKILLSVNEDEQLPNFKRTTFYKLLKKMNFKYAARSRKSLLLERDEIIAWRRDYLKVIKKYREEGRQIFYTDETWVNAGHTKTKIWVDTTVVSSRQAFLKGLSTGLKNPSGKGKRLIITHIGNENGFLEDGLLLFEASKSDGDYHGEMTADVYETWFTSICQKLPQNAVVVMDNAPYHSRHLEKLPTTNWRKDELKSWLREKNIPFEEDALKAQLVTLAKLHKNQYKMMVIDEIAKAHGITILRQPPYHCELNAIELIWAQIKSHVAANNKGFRLAEVKELFTEGISLITAEKWEKCISHVIKEESRMYKLDDIVEVTVEKLVINVGEDSSDDENSD